MDLISIKQLNKKKFTINVRNHEICVDASVKDGGQDEAMSPVELLAGALGVCVGMMTYTYCSSHNLPSEGIELSVVPTLADKPKRIEALTVDLSLPEGVPEEKMDAILRVAKACVIHNTLQNKPNIDIDMA